MRYYSIFSGIEAASVAWEPLGWEPLLFSEIDEFPSAVLKARFPSVPNSGDITKINWKEAVRDFGRPDIVVGGSPCQSFSVAGTRTGLEGASGLMWEYVRCVRELKPDWILWENVPGALSSSHGEDFRCLLEALDACGYGLAWRVLDAQFFGLAQRRERVFLVGRLGDVEGPCKVLFEPESLSWDTQSSREKRKELAAESRSRAAVSGGTDAGVARDICIQGDIARGAHFGQNGRGYSTDGSSYTLNTLDVPAVVAPSGTPIYEIQGNAIDRDTAQNGAWACDPDENGAYTLNATDVDGVLCMTDTQPHSMVSGEVCGTLTATMHKDPPVVAKTLKIRGGCEGGGKGPLVQEDVSATLGTSNDQTLFEPVAFAANQRGELRLQGGDGTVVGAVPASQSGKQAQGVTDGYAVRRLTPRECERLQGFPDDWTRIPYRGKPAEECPDTPRYKAIGNSMAVPVMRWIGERIELEEMGQ